MAKLISFGKYDKKYKYVIFYILIRLPFEYFLGDFFPEEIKIKYFRRENFPNKIIIYEIFKYLGILIFGLIVLKIEIESLFNENKNYNNDNQGSKKEIELIYYENQSFPNTAPTPVFLVIILYVIDIKMIDFCYSIFFISGLEFWMIEIIFIVVINIILFKIKIYIHQKVSIAIILFFSTLMKIISIISIFKNDKKRIFVENIWIAPVGIILFLLLYFADAYIICKMKWYFDLKFISDKKILILFGFLGTIIFFLCSIISHFIECNTDIFSSYLCSVYDEKDSKKYFDNFIIFFKNIWMEDRNAFVNCLYILIIILKILFSAFQYFFSFLIIKLLGPEYLVCADSILFFLIKIISLIFYLINKSLKIEFLFDFLSQFFSLLGTIIYLELIELNFCKLNYNLKRNINIRSNIEILDIFNESDDKSEQESNSGD